tara:strand:- start:699 stop:1127 length:429 start_codon:yes stop_codon:yes gene_type:complete
MPDRIKCPLGLIYRDKCIRTIKSVWNKQSTKDYIIESVKRSTANIKPIIIIDDKNIELEAECYLINSSLNGFDEYHDKILCRQVESIAEFSTVKYKIQSSNELSTSDKRKYCTINEKRNYKHQKLDSNEEKEYNKLLKMVKQ